MRKAITDVTIRLLYRGDKGPKSVGKSETDTQLSALNSQKQQTMALMCRIYIGSINFSVNEEMIRVAFSPFGPVKHINMSLDLTTNRHKGFAFLEFETPEAAYLSLTQMEGVVLGGRNIKVGRPSNMPLAEPMINQLLQEAKAFPRIYIGSIHPSINKEDVIRYLAILILS
ncbi:MAG: Poly(U)-binding-splicing factor puf60 [Marteilia pararefringens]